MRPSVWQPAYTYTNLQQIIPYVSLWMTPFPWYSDCKTLWDSESVNPIKPWLDSRLTETGNRNVLFSEKFYKLKLQNNKVNGNRIILINNYLKCKWVECPNQKTKTGWMDTKTRPLYMLFTRDPLQTKGHIQTESEGLEKDISCKWRPKESRSSNTYIR